MTRKTLAGVSGWFGVAVLLAASWLYSDYANRPKQPIPEQGRVWEINNHGYLTYVTTPEYVLWFGLTMVGIGAMGAGMWLHQQTKGK